MNRQWLKEQRIMKNMTQSEIANAAGITQSYYADIENGNRGAHIKGEIAKKIATALNFDWTRFYEDGDPAQPQEEAAL